MVEELGRGIAHAVVHEGGEITAEEITEEATAAEITVESTDADIIQGDYAKQIPEEANAAEITMEDKANEVFILII